MNITPLIDVLLVLLHAVPAARDRLTVDLLTPSADGPVPEKTGNLLSFDAKDRLASIRKPISWNQQLLLLQAVRPKPIKPQIRCAPAAGAMAMVWESGVTRIGLVGNEQSRQFNRD